MKYILTANSFDVVAHWSKKIGLDPHGKRAVFIDTAANMYDKPNQAWLQEDRQSLVDLGFSVCDYDLVGKKKRDVLRDLSDAALIFVSGGNTFFLLEHAQKSGFVELIKENAFPNALYVGSSAGSVLLSNDIDAVKFLDDPKEAHLTSTKGIGILDAVVLPHWGSKKFAERYKKTYDYVYKNEIAVITLANHQYIIIDGKEFELCTVEGIDEE